MSKQPLIFCFPLEVQTLLIFIAAGRERTLQKEKKKPTKKKTDKKTPKQTKKTKP